MHLTRVAHVTAKMSSGQALTDEDRMPWLALLAEAIQKHASSNKPTVFACSALKRKYRDILAAKAASGSPAHVLFVSTHAASCLHAGTSCLSTGYASSCMQDRRFFLE